MTHPAFPVAAASPASSPPASSAATQGAAPDLASVVRHCVGERSWGAWFEGKSAFELAGVELTVKAGSPFVLTYLQRRFSAPLRDAARLLGGPAGCVGYAVDAALLDDALVRGEAKRSRGEPAAVLPFRAPHADKPGAETPTPSAEAAPAVGPATGLHRPRRLRDFGSFVAGPETELALTAAARFAAGAARTLYLYGPSGVGKTHLLEGAVQTMRRRTAGGRVLLMTAEAFANLYTDGLRGRGLPAFRQKVRAADALVIDDVDFLDGKEGFAEEFLHTLQEYERLGRPVAVSADRHPRLLTKTPDELLTRLASGVVTRLAPPDAATRVAILRRKLEGKNLPVTADALKWVAERFRGSVRELEGALCCLETWREMTGKSVTLPAARKVLSDLERDCARQIRLDDVERAVCDAAGLTPEELRSKSRTKRVTRPRMVAMHLCRKHTGAALREIGGHFGGRNHSTVLSADRSVSGWLAGSDAAAADAVALIDAAEARLLAG
ncbi:DnaA/Hda family protein [Alienimonas californiensis]|uniref:Chromosomal replication initiator protein DnaA n=1 Tax=Alienimonas californiensis TaxID=2527989 RepID=A0A517PC39_9PLAN|nr:DnaA/Hda family protein [Alienimonas californiensis]QDT16940.1 Chromosomal replication initiator protein DnaA [Alienimonas californiensis]